METMKMKTVKTMKMKTMKVIMIKMRTIKVLTYSTHMTFRGMTSSRGRTHSKRLIFDGCPLILLHFCINDMNNMCPKFHDVNNISINNFSILCWDYYTHYYVYHFTFIIKNLLIYNMIL